MTEAEIARQLFDASFAMKPAYRTQALCIARYYCTLTDQDPDPIEDRARNEMRMASPPRRRGGK